MIKAEDIIKSYGNGESRFQVLKGCILRHPTADFAEQNGRNAKLIGHRPLPL